jgi:hypothetical protein
MGSLHKVKYVLKLSTTFRVPFFSFFLFAKLVLLKVVYPLKICQQSKFHGLTLTSASSAFTTAV